MALSLKQKNKIVELAKAYGASRVILFGSSLNPAMHARDIDIACDGIPGWKIYEFGARLEEELETPLDVIPLGQPTRFTKMIESRGKVLL